MNQSSISSPTSSATSQSASISLPQSIFTDLLNTSNETEMSFLFGALNSSILYPQANQTNENFTVDSAIISATIIGYEHTVMNLSEDVTIAIKLHSEVCTSPL